MNHLGSQCNAEWQCTFGEKMDVPLKEAKLVGNVRLYKKVPRYVVP